MLKLLLVSVEEIKFVKIISLKNKIFVSAVQPLRIRQVKWVFPLKTEDKGVNTV
jgi:hypothetical protein